MPGAAGCVATDLKTSKNVATEAYWVRKKCGVQEERRERGGRREKCGSGCLRLHSSPGKEQRQSGGWIPNRRPHLPLGLSTTPDTGESRRTHLPGYGSRSNSERELIQTAMAMQTGRQDTFSHPPTRRRP